MSKFDTIGGQVKYSDQASADPHCSGLTVAQRFWLRNYVNYMIYTERSANGFESGG